jgi:hypothetical protein
VLTFIASLLLREVKLRSTSGLQRSASEAGETSFSEPAII